jgi:hypothetical protein
MDSNVANVRLPVPGVPVIPILQGSKPHHPHKETFSLLGPTMNVTGS